MLERDYLMRIIMELGAGIRRSLERAEVDRDPEDAAKLLEMAMGEAVDIDGATLLSLAPESIATIMQATGTDPAVTEYVVRSLFLASHYYASAGNGPLAELRTLQAEAVAAAYGHAITREDAAPAAMEEALAAIGQGPGQGEPKRN